MPRERWKELLSYLLICGGTVLVFLGARIVIDSYLGQTTAAHNFTTAPQRPVASARGPERGATVAKLIIPRLGAQLYVFEGDDERELRRGPGHLADTPMPGRHGNCVIAGHRDTHFRVLKDIRKNDDIVVETSSGQYLYRVNATHIVSPSNTHALQPTRSPVLNLITCYPFYYVGSSAPQRFVVEARLAGEVSGNAEKTKISKIRNAR